MLHVENGYIKPCLEQNCTWTYFND